jgi:hypothetical protein
MVHICNPSYSEGRDQEDSGSKSAWANSSRDPILEKPITKNRTGGAAQGEDPEFKPQHWEKKKRWGVSICSPVLLSSCLSFPHAGIIGICHHAWLECLMTSTCKHSEGKEHGSR